MLNVLMADTFSGFNAFGPKNSFKTYMTWARRSPQIMGFLNIIATDMLSDTITFDPLDNRSGRNRVKKAEEYWKVNRGLEVSEATIYDLLLLGAGFNWVGKLDEEKIKELCKEVVDLKFKNKFSNEFKEYKTQALYETLKNGELSSFAKKLRHIPASTVDIKNNEYQITDYIQSVGVRTKTFKPNEIIMFSLMPLDGKPFPFSPMESLLAEVYLLWLISQNYVSLFENGGNPDKIFILPKEMAGSKNHRYLIDVLRKYKKIQNKHGNLVFTGELNIQDMMKFESQMEHRELGLYVVGVMAMFYGVPVSRIPFLIGRAANMGDSGGLADSGYWRKISVWQSKLEEGYNTCIFNPYFGVSLKFGRAYKQDEVRETQNEMQKTQVAEQRLRLGLWDEYDAGKYLGIDPEIIDNAMNKKKKRDEEFRTGMERQNLENDDNVQNEPDKKLKNKKKQDTQIDNQINDGGKKINP
jgi:hypothetical protein